MQFMHGLNCTFPSSYLQHAMLYTCYRSFLPRPVMEAICGAVGEVAQICILYPLETIKVHFFGTDLVPLWLSEVWSVDRYINIHSC